MRLASDENLQHSRQFLNVIYRRSGIVSPHNFTMPILIVPWVPVLDDNLKIIFHKFNVWKMLVSDTVYCRWNVANIFYCGALLSKKRIKKLGIFPKVFSKFINMHFSGGQGDTTTFFSNTNLAYFWLNILQVYTLHMYIKNNYITNILNMEDTMLSWKFVKDLLTKNFFTKNEMWKQGCSSQRDLWITLWSLC